jgi:8-oxo-dGTP pyrophosphatase MutT (NUDIX family)
VKSVALKAGPGAKEREVRALGPRALKARIVARLDPLTGDSATLAAWSDEGVGDTLDLALGPAALPNLTPAAVLVCLLERPDGLSVILTRRADTLRRHTGQVAFPGGRSDPGETPWATALREAEEEIGLEPGRVTLAGLATPYLTVTGYHVTPVVGFAPADVALKANPDEVADIFETPFTFLMDLANYETREGRTPGGDPRRYYAICWEGRLIWGATAGMLRALHERLYGAAQP